MRGVTRTDRIFCTNCRAMVDIHHSCDGDRKRTRHCEHGEPIHSYRRDAKHSTNCDKCRLVVNRSARQSIRKRLGDLEKTLRLVRLCVLTGSMPSKLVDRIEELCGAEEEEATP